jgi:hypothetical protein
MKRKRDYLKYWRVIRQFIVVKYKLKYAELDMMLFLYSEDRFTKDKFQEFNEVLPWDVQRFEKMRREGWITVFRKRHGKHKALYELSYKGKNLIDMVYRKVEGEEIPMTKQNNPMFFANTNYSNKVYRNFIKKMTEFTRQQRHLALESQSTDSPELSS